MQQHTTAQTSVLFRTHSYPPSQVNRAGAVNSSARILILKPDQDRSVGVQLDSERAEDGTIVVSHDHLALYGVGRNSREAAQDFLDMAKAMYEDLTEEGYELSEPLQRRLDELRRYLSWWLE